MTDEVTGDSVINKRNKEYYHEQAQNIHRTEMNSK